MNDNEIVQSMLHDFNNTPSLEEIEKTEKNLLWYCLFVIKNKSKFFRGTAGCNFVNVNDGIQVVGHTSKIKKESISLNKRFWPNFPPKISV